ncbi:FMN-dependent NADH-azoreductase [Rhodomicrobium sp.]|uniref:FMN-dependent NADH-azoreductase n=1 Tax=Rhodomicrobium sp. TaxID=2720632 RepID=UPI0039E2A322
MKLLHIDSSVLGQHSVSRALSAETVARQRALHPGIEVVYRDLVAEPLLHLSPAHIAVFQGAAPENDTLAADIADGAKLLDTVFEASVLVIGAPMYNFGISSQLKAWVDRILIAGRTFRYTTEGPEGLLPGGKKAFIVSSRGGSYGQKAADHQEDHLKIALGFIGITDISIIRAENISRGADAREAALAAAREEISSLAA